MCWPMVIHSPYPLILNEWLKNVLSAKPNQSLGIEDDDRSSVHTEILHQKNCGVNPHTTNHLSWDNPHYFPWTIPTGARFKWQNHHFVLVKAFMFGTTFFPLGIRHLSQVISSQVKSHTCCLFQLLVGEQKPGPKTAAKPSGHEANQSLADGTVPEAKHGWPHPTTKGLLSKTYEFQQQEEPRSKHMQWWTWVEGLTDQHWYAYQPRKHDRHEMCLWRRTCTFLWANHGEPFQLNSPGDVLTISIYIVKQCHMARQLDYDSVVASFRTTLVAGEEQNGVFRFNSSETNARRWWSNSTEIFMFILMNKSQTWWTPKKESTHMHWRNNLRQSGNKSQSQQLCSAGLGFVTPILAKIKHTHNILYSLC